MASHTAHLESILAGEPEETAEVGEPAHVTGLMGIYTEIGVVNRRDASPDAIINEIRSVTTTRHTALLADPPTDGSAKPEPIFGGVPWDWETLLRNRPLDIWMHEQDVRRAVGRPGNLDSPAAKHTADYLAEASGFVLAKRVGAPPARRRCSRSRAASPLAFTVNDAGRGKRLPEPPAEPTSGCRWTASRSSCSPAAGARRSPARSRSRATRSSASGSSTRWRPRREPGEGRGRHLADRRHPRPGRAHHRW